MKMNTTFENDRSSETRVTVEGLEKRERIAV
jgi:hypothetical protein